MPILESGQRVYPIPEHNPCGSGPPTIFDRWQLVIPCFDKEQADRISARVAEFCSHNKEHIWAVTDNECNTILSEAVLERELVSLPMAFIPDESEPVSA
jgi:hypothetical protein